MPKIFEDNEDSETELTFQTDNQYAKNYNAWRSKELLNGLKTKYGNIDLSDEDDTSGSDDDEDEADFSPDVDLKFLKTLSSLKSKDPSIYDDKVKFFDDNLIDPTVKKKKTEERMFLKDYERNMLLHGRLGDEDVDIERPDDKSMTYVQEQDSLKQNLKKQLDQVREVEEDDDFLQTRVKSKEERDEEELDYKQWLKGKRESLENESNAAGLKTLKEYWDDPNLESGEKFLRDYILNNGFRESHDSNYIPTYDEIVHDDVDLSDDADNVEKQEEFEYKFNYRYEEPDQQFLKRYPRTMEHSLRKTDDRRKAKRREVKDRKIVEKAERMKELQKLKELKRQEIEEKIKKLKEVTGNTEVAFESNYFDDDFNPEEHDKRMQSLFDEEFYQGEEGDEKPEFPDLDEELELERWDKYNKEQIISADGVTLEPHAEDEDFNMDCDYDPKTANQSEVLKGRKRRKRKSKFAEVVSETKPIFDPIDKTYEEYLDEYYKLDCEDIVAGIPCRFKYRKVAANCFGLTIDEILKANDKELNRWCSIKKAVQHRPDHVEKYDQIAYKKKAQNEALKRRILPSLYQEDEAETSSFNPETTQGKKRKHNKSPTKQNLCSTNVNEGENEKVEGNDVKQIKKKKRKHTNELIANKHQQESRDSKSNGLLQEEHKRDNNSKSPPAIKKNSGKKNVGPNESRMKCTRKNKTKNNKRAVDSQLQLSDARLKAFGIKPKKYKNKLKFGRKNTAE